MPIDSIDYLPRDYTKCRLERNGNVCPRDHGKGYIVLLPDQKAGHVGWCCYDKYLRENANFSSGVNSLIRRQRATEVQGRVDAFLGNAALVSRVEALRPEHERLVSRISVVRVALSFDVLSKLDDMRRTRSSQVGIRANYEVRDEDGKPVADWRKFIMGRVRGFAILDRAREKQIKESVGKVVGALDDARSRVDPSSNDVDRWAVAFVGVDGAERELRRFHAELDAFYKPANVELLLYVGHHIGALPRVYRQVNLILGRQEVTQVQSERAAAAWLEGHRKAHGDREVKPLW
ncbi:MAG: hypothetical protein WD944_06545 [Steroidobacteraceae bacterium]